MASIRLVATCCSCVAVAGAVVRGEAPALLAWRRGCGGMAGSTFCPVAATGSRGPERMLSAGGVHGVMRKAFMVK